jgi:Tfp pilus assembly protein PilV
MELMHDAGDETMEPTTHGRSAAGFSLIEALIATGILLMIAIGIIPLFATSIMNNTRGSDSTQSTNYSRTQVENLLQLPFNGTTLTVPAAASQAETDEWWAVGATNAINDSAEGWKDSSVTPKPVKTVSPWSRTTIVTQYSVAALSDGVLDPKTEAENGTTPPNNVHLKVVQVEVDSSKAGVILQDTSKFGAALGAGEKITIQVVKAF